MPVKSEAQRRAMEAAKHGHSTLGISREAATKFLADDSGPGYMPVKHAAGVVHVAPDGSILLLKRGGKEGVDNFVGHWALPGGGANDGESPIAAAHRETMEETGFDGRGPLKLLDQVKTPNGMAFHTFVRPTRVFEPKLNAEHSDWAWVQPDELPEHTHPAVKSCLEKVPSGRELYDWATADEDLAQDSVHAACGGRGCAGCGGSGVSPITYAPMKPSLANDEATVLLDEIARQFRGLTEPMAMDRAPDGVALDRRGVVVTLAFDKTSESVRRTDNFERLHVKSSPITKAGVNPYYGREIPKAKELGLDPNRVYRLLRHPDELKKGAATFNNLPLLSQHRPHTADDHDGGITVGTTGSNAEYVHPYLYNSLAVWSRDGIDHVETGDQKELSSAYGYDADMSPGVYEGEPYDGIMRNLVGNHVALVKKGRAGSDVVVGDEALQPIMESPMATKPIKFKNAKAAVSYRVVTAYLRSQLKLQPKIAMDAQINIAGALETIEAQKFKESVPDFLKALENVLKKKPALIAQDGADLAGVVKGVQQLMTAVGGDKTVKEDEATVEPADMEDPSSGEGGEAEVADDGGMDAVAAYLKEKGVPDDIIAGMPGMGGGAEDEGGPTDDMEKRLAGKKPGMDNDEVVPDGGPDGKKKPVTEGAMDAALQKVRKETIAEMNAVNEARAHVKPIVGEIAMAFDSAEAVYQQAFTMIGKKDAAKLKGVTVLKTMWDMVPAPGARQQREQIAQDTDSVADFAKRFPNASRVHSAGGR